MYKTYQEFMEDKEYCKNKKCLGMECSECVWTEAYEAGRQSVLKDLKVKEDTLGYAVYPYEND